MLNATHEVHIFMREVVNQAWQPANLLFGVPMHPFIWVYTGLSAVWVYQLARLSVNLQSILFGLAIPLSAFAGDYFKGDGFIFHVVISCVQCFMFLVLVLGFSRLEVGKVEERVVVD